MQDKIQIRMEAYDYEALDQAALDIVDIKTEEGRGEVRSRLPLAAVLGYATQLRTLTRGMGTVHLRPIDLRPVPPTAL